MSSELTYEQRRDLYLEHVRNCIYCGYSLTKLSDGCNVPWCPDFGQQIKYHSVSHLCKVGIKLLEDII